MIHQVDEPAMRVVGNGDRTREEREVPCLWCGGLHVVHSFDLMVTGMMISQVHSQGKLQNVSIACVVCVICPPSQALVGVARIIRVLGIMPQHACQSRHCATGQREPPKYKWVDYRPLQLLGVDLRLAASISDRITSGPQAPRCHGTQCQ